MAAKIPTGNQTGVDARPPHAEHAVAPNKTRHDGTPLVGRSVAGDQTVRKTIAAGLDTATTPGIRITKGVKDEEANLMMSRRAGPAARDVRLDLDPHWLSRRPNQVTQELLVALTGPLTQDLSARKVESPPRRPIP